MTMAIPYISKMISDKKRYREHRARIATFPPNYRAAIEALERYLMYFGGLTDGALVATMLDDLGDLFEQSAADDTPIRAIVGEDPVEFVETFLTNYSEGQWINKERARLIKAIDSVTENDT
jgi:DNA-binding ferritin-like protein (Dps family)